ncbi:hypothetical protein L843_4149 [Mycobacterium intracellulare MIN_061107_1834]|nr:hypothetical protein L843_4149 [Mycobacterium intracellulare MIN_061107_1834]
MSQDVLVTKPSSGHWTDAYPELGRGPVSLEDCVSEEFYEKNASTSSKNLALRRTG